MKYTYNYDEFLRDSLVLSQKIDWEFDTIVAIGRGGLTLAHFFGEYYDLRSVYIVNTIGYDDTHKKESVEVFNIPDLKNAKKILILDDIVDSGDTMKLVLERLSELYPDCHFKSASLFYKPTAIMQPDWYAQKTEAWIEFFWATDMENS